jgi:hypothetical protein
MMETIQQTLWNTPWWVYVLLVYLIKIGIRASKKNIVSLKKLLIIPLVFTFMSLHTLIYAFAIDVTTLSVWSISIVVGILLGWIQVFQYDLRVDKSSGLIEIPGTWSTLIIILIIFATKYYFGYELSVDPVIAHNTVFEVSALTISGVCTGLFVGRVLCYFYQFSRHKSVSLS